MNVHGDVYVEEMRREAYLELKAKKELELFEAMRPGVELLMLSVAREVVECPELADCASEYFVGHCQVIYPTFAEAQAFLREELAVPDEEC